MFFDSLGQARLQYALARKAHMTDDWYFDLLERVLNPIANGIVTA